MQQPCIIDRHNSARLAAIITYIISAVGCISSEEAITFSNQQEQLLNVRADAALHPSGKDYIGKGATVVGDIDGDGMDDMVIGYRPNIPHPPGVRYADYLQVVYGRTDWSGDIELTGNPIINVETELQSMYDMRVAAVGDVDGDGFDDFIITALPSGGTCRIIQYFVESGGADREEMYLYHPEIELQGIAYLVYGGPQRLTGVQQVNDIAAEFHEQTRCTGFGEQITGLGDIDGDGYDDFAIGSDLGEQPPQDQLDLMRTYIFYGNPTRYAGTLSAPEAAAAALRTDARDSYVDELSKAGDVNGDGYDDFFITPYFPGLIDSESEQFYLISGSMDRLAGDLTIADVATSTGTGLFGRAPMHIGDINNDGVDDFYVSAGINDEFVDAVFYGRKDGFGAIIRPDQADGELRNRVWSGRFSVVLGPGDVDGDGNSDLMIGIPRYNASGGAGFLVHGNDNHFAGTTVLEDQGTAFIGRSGSRTLYDNGIPYEWPNFELAGEYTSTGDFNGDNIPDFALSATGGFEQHIYLLLSPFVTP